MGWGLKKREKRPATKAELAEALRAVGAGAARGDAALAGAVLELERARVAYRALSRTVSALIEGAIAGAPEGAIPTAPEGVSHGGN